MTLAQRRTECFRKRTATTAIPKRITFDRIKPCSDPITMKWDTREFFSTPPMCNASNVVAKSPVPMLTGMKLAHVQRKQRGGEVRQLEEDEYQLRDQEGFLQLGQTDTLS